MAKLPHDLEPIAEDAVQRVANIFGPQSAAAGALRDLEEKRKAGLNPAIGFSRKHNCFIVADVGRG